MKSKWKFNYFNLYFNNRIEFTKNRNYPINSSLLNKIIHVHNGKNYYKILITKDMLYKKLGFFFKTKKKHVFKYNKKKNVNKLCVDQIYPLFVNILNDYLIEIVIFFILNFYIKIYLWLNI